MRGVFFYLDLVDSYMLFNYRDVYWVVSFIFEDYRVFYKSKEDNYNVR